MDELRKLLQDDLPRLGTYFLDMTAAQGDGVLLVNYYPNDKISQMEAKFLKAGVIRKWARQIGLADLESQFETYDRQTQMVVAVVTPETKGTVTVEVSPTPVSKPEPETPVPPAKSAATKSNAKHKTPTRTTATSPAPEPETPAPPAKPPTKHKARRNPTRTTARRRKTT